MVLIFKEHHTKHGYLYIVTDKDILGKKFEEGKLQLDLTKKFYFGEEITKDELKKKIKQARHIHLTGKEAVAVGVEMDLVDPEKILYVKKIPHAEVMIEN